MSKEVAPVICPKCGAYLLKSKVGCIVCGWGSEEKVQPVEVVDLDQVVDAVIEEGIPGTQLELVNPIDNVEEDMKNKKIHIVSNPYQLRINYKPYAKLWHWVQAAEGEVAGLGLVRRDGDVFIVQDVYLLAQTCSQVGAMLSDEALTEFLYNLAVRGKNPALFNFSWHSHVNMGTFWSSIDEANCVRHSTESELISLVMNKKGSILARRDYKGLTNHNVPVVIVPTGYQRVQAKCYKQVRAKVKTTHCGDLSAMDDALLGYML